MEDNLKNNKEKPAVTGGNDKVLKYYIKIVLVFAALSLTFWLGFEKGQNNAHNSKVTTPSAISKSDIESVEQIDFSLFWEVWDILQEKYVDAKSITSEELLFNSIKGMLWATKDPYTIFLDPKENKEFNESIEGKFEGIGAEMGIKQGILTVVAPLQDSPAEQSGLRAGDKVLKIDGEPTVEMNIDEAVSKIRGKKGTEVVLNIFRNNGEDKTIDISVTRDVIKVKSVTFEIKNDDVAYFNIMRFGDDTVRSFRKFINKVPKNTKGIILDLRNNPGGYLDSSVDIASLMLPRGKVVVIEEDKDGNKVKKFSKGGDKLSSIKTLVLINEGTASASEILAGALRDNRTNVTIIGEKSFGKGSVQELIDLKGGSAVKVTIAKWLTPNGEQINEKGIAPDVEVELSNDDYDNDRDPQLDKALELLK